MNMKQTKFRSSLSSSIILLLVRLGFLLLLLLAESFFVQANNLITPLTPSSITATTNLEVNLGSSLHFSDCSSTKDNQQLCKNVLAVMGLGDANSSIAALMQPGIFLSSSSGSGLGLFRITFSFPKNNNNNNNGGQQNSSPSTSTTSTTTIAPTGITTTTINNETSMSFTSTSVTSEGSSTTTEVPTSTTAFASTSTTSSSSSSSSSSNPFYPLPCNVETGKILPHIKSQDDNFLNTTIIVPFFASCFIQNPTSTSNSQWLPRSKWCSLLENSFDYQQEQIIAAGVRNEILDFLKKVEMSLPSTSAVKSSLPIELQEFMTYLRSVGYVLSTSSSALLPLAVEKFSSIGICGKLNSSQSSSYSAMPEIFVSSQVFGISSSANNNNNPVYQSFHYTLLDNNVNLLQTVTLLPGFPAALDFVNVDDDGTSQKSWCSSFQQTTKLSFGTPLPSSTSLTLQVVDSWGNPTIFLSSSNENAKKQVKSMLENIKLSVSITYSSLNGLPNSTITAARNFEKKSSGIFCVNENRHLWVFNYSGSYVRITGFSISLCSMDANVGDKLLSLTATATTKSSVSGMDASDLYSSSSFSSSTSGNSHGRRAENVRISINPLMTRLASGLPIKLRLNVVTLDQTLSFSSSMTMNSNNNNSQTSSSSSSTTTSSRQQGGSTSLFLLSNQLQSCLSQGFYIQTVQPSALTLVPSSVLPWHVRTSSSSSTSDSFQEQYFNNNNNNDATTDSKTNFMKNLMSLDPFAATWGTLGMSDRLSQSIAWTKTSCKFCDGSTQGSNDENLAAVRHFSFPLSQDAFQFGNSINNPLPTSVLVNTEIFLTDFQGILVKDKTVKRTFVDASSNNNNNNNNNNGMTMNEETWSVSCDATINLNEEMLLNYLESVDVQNPGNSGLDATALLVRQGNVTAITSSSSSNVVTGRWTPFPSFASSSSSSSANSIDSTVVRAQVQFNIPLTNQNVQRRQGKSGPVTFSNDFFFSVNCKASSSSSFSLFQQDYLQTSAVFHLETFGEYECNNLETAFDVANALSSLDAVALNALVASVNDDTSSVPLAAALSPPLVQVYLPSALAAESELAYLSGRTDQASALPAGFVFDSKIPSGSDSSSSSASSSSSTMLSNQQKQMVALRRSYDPRIGIPWFPDSGLTSWILIPRTSYLNIPLGIMTAMAFGTSYAVTRRLVLALNRPICSSSVGRLETAVSDWVYALANNLTTTMTRSTVLGKGSSTAFSSAGGRGRDSSSSSGAVVQEETVAPRQSSFTLQHSATGAVQLTKWTSCYGAGVETLEFVALQCCQNDAAFLSELTELTPSQQKASYKNYGSVSAETDTRFFVGVNEETSCGVYVLGTLGPVMVSGAGVGGVLASIGICFYIWVLLSGSTAEMKSWKDMTAVEQWRTSILHVIAPWIPAVHAYFNFGSTTYSGEIVFWVDIGAALIWYFGVLLHVLGRWVGGGKRSSFPFKSTRYVYIFSQVLLLAYSHFLIVNAFLWIAASLHINLALVPYASGYAVIAIHMWLSVQYFASELEPSLITGRFPQHTMAPVDAGLSCTYFTIIVTVFLAFVSQVSGLTPFMGVAAAFVIFLLLLLFNFAPGESIRLALQSQLEESGGGGGENTGSRMADFLRAFLGQQPVVMEDEEGGQMNNNNEGDDYDDDGEYFDDDDDGNGNEEHLLNPNDGCEDEEGEYFDDAGEFFNPVPIVTNADGGTANNEHDDQEMTTILPTSRNRNLSKMSQKTNNSLASRKSRQASQFSQNSNGGGNQSSGLDPELAARLMSTLPKLLNLAGNKSSLGAATANGSGTGTGLTPNDIANATKLLGTLQSAYNGNNNNNNNNNNGGSGSPTSPSLNSSNNNNQNMNHLNLLINTISGTGALDPQHQALLSGIQMAANVAAGTNNNNSNNNNNGNVTENKQVASPTANGENSSTTVNASDLAVLLQAVNALNQANVNNATAQYQQQQQQQQHRQLQRNRHNNNNNSRLHNHNQNVTISPPGSGSRKNRALSTTSANNNNNSFGVAGNNNNNGSFTVPSATAALPMNHNSNNSFSRNNNNNVSFSMNNSPTASSNNNNNNFLNVVANGNTSFGNVNNNNNNARLRGRSFNNNVRRGTVVNNNNNSPTASSNNNSITRRRDGSLNVMNNSSFVSRSPGRSPNGVDQWDI